MKISDVRVRKIATEGKLKAYVTITFDSCFVIHNVKVIEGKNGPFIAMPSRKTKNGEYKDVAHPINSEFRAELQETILKFYEEAEDIPLKETSDSDPVNEVKSGDDFSDDSEFNSFNENKKTSGTQDAVSGILD